MRCHAADTGAALDVARLGSGDESAADASSADAAVVDGETMRPRRGCRARLGRYCVDRMILEFRFESHRFGWSRQITGRWRGHAREVAAVDVTVDLSMPQLFGTSAAPIASLRRA